MASLDKETAYPLLLALLVGAGGGTGAGSLLSQHEHPAIIAEIRKVEYESEIFKLEVQLEQMDPEAPEYTVAESQLVKFNDMLLELRQ